MKDIERYKDVDGWLQGQVAETECKRVVAYGINRLSIDRCGKLQQE